METLSSHYARLLGLNDSWRVESVDLQIEDRRVEIRLSHVGSSAFCPECGGACGLADHADERRWRHLDTMQFTTELVARLPRSRCGELDSLPEAYDWIRADLAAGRISADELARAAVQYGNMGTIRRIGAILERIDVSKVARSRLERAVTTTTAKIPLVPTRPARGPVSRAWAVVINA